MFQLPTQREILKWNRALPDHLRQCSVVLNFKKPMPRSRVEHFYRIRMTRNMLSAGEQDFWIPEITQPGSVGKQKCLGCNNIMRRVGVLSSTCVNPLCINSGKVLMTGPKRGVHSVKVEFGVVLPDTGVERTITFVVGQEWLSVDRDVWLNVAWNKLKKRGYKITCTEETPVNMVEDLIQQSAGSILKWPMNKMPVDMVCGCILVLDRRYSDECLCSVYRTVGELCDMLGWELK